MSNSRFIVLLSGLLLWLSFSFVPVMAGDSLNYFGVGAGARAIGMGNAFVAVADDASAPVYNPAGLARQEAINLLITGRTINSDDDTLFDAQNINENSILYAGVAFMGYGLSWQRLLAYSGSSGEANYDVSLESLGLATGQSIGPVAIGARFQYLTGSFNFEGGPVPPLDVEFSGYSLDIGALADIGPVRLGAAVQNLVSDLGVDVTSDDSDDDLSRKIVVGASFRPLDTLLLAVDLEDFDYDLDSRKESFTTVHAGLEWWPVPEIFALRAGAYGKDLVEETGAVYSVGAGLRLGALNLDLALSGEEVLKAAQGGFDETETETDIAVTLSGGIIF